MQRAVGGYWIIRRLTFLIFSGLGLLFGVSGTPVYAQQSAIAPSAFVAESRYEFSPVIEGQSVSHNYILENRGDAPLFIERIVTGCGCTAVDYDRQIPPGGVGTVIVKVDTNGYGGQQLGYAVEVYTNDPVQPLVRLWVQGDVLEFVRLSKRVVQLKGVVGERLEDGIDIEPVIPFKIVEVNAEPGQDIRVTMTVESSRDPVRYRVSVENTASSPARYFEKIIIRTDNTIRPELTILVQGNIR
jgi:hypothetical protein